VAVAKNGDLYFTDSTSDFTYDKVILAFIANPSGRLIHFERKTGKLTVLIDNLWFANGVVLSPNEDFIVVSDLARSKLVKYWLKTEKAGESETFAEGLPGTPDNLTPDKNGIWVALPMTADPQNPYLAQSTAQLPLVRKFQLRLMSLLDLLFTTIDSFFPNDFCKYVAASIGNGEFVKFMFPPRATILRLDWNGNIIAAYHSFNGAVYTHVLEMNGHLYLGSISHDFIAKVVKRAHL
jgi:adipocyte plasma membrane-associated protein